MTKRDAPRTAFGNGFSPFGSEVFRKSRFALYSLRPISRQPNHGLSACTRSYGGHARNGSKLRFGRKRFAHQIARETADNDVLAQLGDLGFDKVAYRLIRIFDEPLLEQTNGTEKLVEFSIDNFLYDILRFPFRLCLVSLAIYFHEHANLALLVNVRRNDSFPSRARRFFASAGNALCAQNRLGFCEVAARFH